jgi:hypothetical protein
MILIRTRQGVGGTKYQVIVRDTGHKTLTRTFRRLSEAKSWAQRMERAAAIQQPATDGCANTVCPNPRS